MGTNYYAQANATEQEVETLKKFGHQIPIVHIGKQSAGWSFSFNAVPSQTAQTLGWGTDDVMSFHQWKHIISSNNISIINEYDDPVSYEDFISLVHESCEGMNHTTVMRNSPIPLERSHGFDRCFYDGEGYSFQWSEFS
jgi:hypothetical protein